MKAQRAFEVTADNLNVAGELMQRLAARGLAAPVELSMLVRCLQAATSAALELQARAAGQPEPKRGD